MTPTEPPTLRILFQSRTTLFSVPGGDTIQVLKTADALRALGCVVDISTELTPDLTGYDVVHLFNLIRPQEVYLQAVNARRQGKPVALSTIYRTSEEYERMARGGLAGLLNRFLSLDQIEYLKVVARMVKNREANPGTYALLRHGYRALQLKTLDLTDALLPNSQSEWSRLRADFPERSLEMAVVVPNAVDTAIFNPALAESRQTEGGVLCVARIEGIKNQLNLVRAMQGLPWSLTLIGKPAPNHLAYYEQVRSEAGPNVTLLGQVEHDDLPRHYLAAKVHCLPSWAETTGLSSLEAGVLGSNLVITDKGDTADYFEDFAFYCDPEDVASIRTAIIRAQEAPLGRDLQRHILDRYTWQHTAIKTLEGYRMALARTRELAVRP